jgi:hypothetical protein
MQLATNTQTDTLVDADLLKCADAGDDFGHEDRN